MAKHAKRPAEGTGEPDEGQLRGFLQTLGDAVDATLVQLVPTADGADAFTWADREASGDLARLTTGFARRWLRAEPARAGDPLPRLELAEVEGWRLIIASIQEPSAERRGALVAARPAARDWSMPERAFVEMAAALCGVVAATSEAAPSHERRLDELVTTIATDLMSVAAATIADTYEHVLQTLTEFFTVDTSLLRRNDHERGVSVLVAEWPRRPEVPDPDPLGEVPFEHSDPVFAASQTLREPLIVRPDAASSDYQKRIQDASGVPAVSVAAVPLLREATTLGVLAFVKFGDRAWSESEINALRAIAALLAQLQARVEAEHQLQVNAYHDELTGLDNRRSFLERLGSVLADRRARPVALFYLDLDRLKAMNDFLGHGAGDRFLRALAGRLREAVRRDDFVARLGGDEFVILAENVGELDDALRIGQGILSAAAEPIAVGGHPISRSASMGVAIGYPGESTVDELLQHADVALLEAKARGRNTIQPFNEEMRAKVEARSEIELHLANAVATGGLRLFYQPEFDLRDGGLLAVEALVRWQHPIRGLLEPDEFIDVAEETNTIIELGRWVLLESCRQLATWRARYPDLALQLRVNVSPAQLISKDLVSVVAAALADWQLVGNMLCLEITERAVFPDLDQVLSTLRELRAIGVQAAIDDFGTGFSSLAQLKTLPVDVLKIDRRFVSGLGADVGDTAIVEAIARLARTFQLELVAEGVETGRVIRELLRIGCHRAQGNLLGRPVPADLLASVLAGERLDVGALLC